MAESEKLFVYGTLMQKARHPMHKVLRRYARYLSEATACGRLYRIADYPGMVADSGCKEKVCGELYEIIDPVRLFRALDRYEGPEYERKTVTVETGGNETKAWTYLYRGSLRGKRSVVGGDFSKIK